VIVVSAPAGSGKTFLLRSWLSEAGLADRAAWVSVPREERDPQRFWVSVVDAVRDTAAASSLVRSLTAAPGLDGWAIVERLLADLGPLREPFWLVIDDMDELRSAEALGQLELLVMPAPDPVRLGAAGRADQQGLGHGPPREPPLHRDLRDRLSRGDHRTQRPDPLPAIRRRLNRLNR
jgi:LuxR family transcriptional regulator, maltose regulon positive regulatory protein